MAASIDFTRNFGSAETFARHGARVSVASRKRENVDPAVKTLRALGSDAFWTVADARHIVRDMEPSAGAKGRLHQVRNRLMFSCRARRQSLVGRERPFAPQSVDARGVRNARAAATHKDAAGNRALRITKFGRLARRNTSQSLMLLGSLENCAGWCPGKDSNLHGLRRWYLKPVRLPIPPPGHGALHRGGRGPMSMPPANREDAAAGREGASPREIQFG